MKDYIIMTDSSCDLPAALAQEMELHVIPLTVIIDGKQYLNYLDERELTIKRCYAMLREGRSATSAAVNVEQFTQAMEPYLQQGKDILYLGFSSGLSSTYSAGVLAATQLMERYPERKIYASDTLCASLGQGMLVYLAVQQKQAGKTIQQVRDYVEATKLNLCHWFTVDDLHHLRRGGRVSIASAVVGTVLGIKPVLHVDDNGRLILMERARGRKAALKRMAQIMAEMAVDPKEQVIFISHGDDLEDAERLANIVREQVGVKEIIIHTVGPVIGAHAGPGTIALFFLGKKR